MQGRGQTHKEKENGMKNGYKEKIKEKKRKWEINKTGSKKRKQNWNMKLRHYLRIKKKKDGERNKTDHKIMPEKAY